MKQKINRSDFERKLRAKHFTLESVPNKNDPRKGTWYYYANVMVPGSIHYRTSGYDPSYGYFVTKRVMVGKWVHGYGEEVDPHEYRS